MWEVKNFADELNLVLKSLFLGMKFLIHFLLLIVFINGSISCTDTRSKLKKKWNESSEYVDEQSKKLRKSAFDAVFGKGSARSTTFSECYGNDLKLNVIENKGVWMDMPAGFYYCFLTYKVDTSVLFSRMIQLEDKENTPGRIVKGDVSEIKIACELLKKDYPNLYQQIPFFVPALNSSNMEFKQLVRFPVTHYFAIDKKSGLIYHFVQNSRD